MNANLITRLLKADVAELYGHNLTPEIFMNRMISLMDALEEHYRAETMSENDLEEILVSSKPKKNKKAANTCCFYDVVDLSMYRAN
jgi:hypothetical protein